MILLWAVHKLRTVSCQRVVMKVPATYLEVMIALETAYMEAEPWFRNTGQQEAAERSGQLAKWFWNRQATLIRHRVS